ncbi:hypothetical protein AB4571_15325 [Vibrio breoganii]|uniref:hypothetical protein n=1 Tax=Vibrio breoganii TaxID=553239 RepID=UPI000C84B10C|nr:hypothetical protein [Vibrio breoganii]PML13830.1 hypothetical protein BCT84_12630 [Vibrio breoganii]
MSRKILGLVVVLSLGVQSAALSSEQAPMYSEDFVLSVEECDPVREQFTHPFTGQRLHREIHELKGDVCIYSEEMPGGMAMDCNWPVNDLSTLSAQYKQLSNAKSVTVSNGVTTVDGEEIDSLLEMYLSTGVCTFRF